MAIVIRKLKDNIEESFLETYKAITDWKQRYLEKEIRKTWENNKWYFSIVDVVYALTDSSNPRRYWKK